MNNKTQQQEDIERIKQAYTSVSRAMIDLTIEDTITALEIDVDKSVVFHLEQWALLHKFDQAINDLVELRKDMLKALQHITLIKAGISQAQSIAFKSITDPKECFDTTPPPDPFLSEDIPPPQDSRK